MTVPSLRRAPALSVECATCRAPYRPRLVGGRCPVCDTPAPGEQARALRRFDDDDDRLLAIVLLATIANVVLLAALAVFVVR